MAKKTTLKAANRARTGSGRLNQMRREGWLPSVIYGLGVENKNLKVDAKGDKATARFRQEYRAGNLNINGSVSAGFNNALTTGTGLLPAIAQGDWMIAGFDLTALGCGLLLAWMARKMLRPQVLAPKRAARTPRAAPLIESEVQ